MRNKDSHSRRRSLAFGALLVALGAMHSLGCAAEAADEEAASASGELAGDRVAGSELVGLYDSPGATFRDVRIRDWGGRPMLSGNVTYNGLLFGVDYLLRSEEGSEATYIGESNIQAGWGDMRCSYPAQVVVVVSRAADGSPSLFVRDHRPMSLPASVPWGSTRCPQVTSMWRTYEVPFAKRTPSARFAREVDELCEATRARLRTVEAARDVTTGPLGPLPPNIYQASGAWQTHSTPGRDTTLRSSMKEIFEFVTDSTRGPDGATIARHLATTWEERNRACVLAYTSSTATSVPLTLGDVVRRAYALSFDPYHCPELRWGADRASAEFATCNTQTPAHLERYDAEKSLRHHVARPADGTPTPLGSGPASAEDIDFVALVQRLAQ
jgi:hypothetical protein